MPETETKTQPAVTATLKALDPWVAQLAVSWNRISGLAKKELYSYFYSPIAYVVMVIYLAFAGWFFFSRFFLYSQLELRTYFELAPLLLMFLAPAITMRLLAEEINSGSYEMLMTLPLTEYQMLLGKFLAALAFLGLTLGVTLSYPLTLATLGRLDWGPVIGGYFGLLILGSAYLALGLFTSALTRNQIVAFILGFALCFALFLSDKVLMLVPGPLVGLFEYLGVEYHFQSFARGLIDSKDLVYFATIIILSLAATRLVLERRK
jgi:ABC-2 type transport system permease protein